MMEADVPLEENGPPNAGAEGELRVHVVGEMVRQQDEANDILQELEAGRDEVVNMFVGPWPRPRGFQPDDHQLIENRRQQDLEGRLDDDDLGAAVGEAVGDAHLPDQADGMAGEYPDDGFDGQQVLPGMPREHEEMGQPPEADASQLLAFLIDTPFDFELGQSVEVATGSAETSFSTVAEYGENEDDSLKPDLSQLPDMATILIFSFLGDSDRSRVARTCKKWSQLVHSGALWRSLEIDLAEPRMERQILGYSERHAKHLRYLVLDNNHPSYNSTKRIQRCMTSFFDKLHGKAKLRLFSLTELQMDRHWRFEISKNRLMVSLNRFLRNQRRLTKFDMSKAQISTSPGLKVLDNLGSGSGATIMELDIQDFFHSRQAVHQMPKFHAVIDNFVNLRKLFINYNCLDEDIVNKIAQNSKRRLNYVAVKVYKNDPHDHRISACSWKKLAHFCPDIRIHFEFEKMSRYYDVCPILVPGLPLHGLQIWSGYEMEDQERLPALVNYIHTVFSSTLELAILEFDNTASFFDDELIALVEKCKKLRILEINCTLCIPTIERICKLQQEGKIELRKFHATLGNLSQVEYAELNFLEEYFADMIEERNLDFEFDTDVIFADVTPEE